MPAPDPANLGPLASLIGTWEGAEGVDVSYHHDTGTIAETTYRERVVASPFGPVENGTQVLYGLDYRMSAWRLGEEEGFHAEVGYWLWDAANEQVMRCFMVPRGATVLAGGPATSDATTLVVQAQVGSQTYGILSNVHLDEVARTTAYQCTVTVHGPDSWSYDETTTLDLARLDEPMAHTDRNTLHRVVG
jgi:hypothetical protein